MSAMPAEPVVPASTVVDVFSEPTPELFTNRLPALAALLRMALLGGMEMALPSMINVILDICDQIVSSDRQLAVLVGDREDVPHLKVCRNLDSERLPNDADNVLNLWTMHVAKPVVAQLGSHPELDNYLRALDVTTAVSVPLFVEHGVSGSLQLFRQTPEPFNQSDAQLLWILSLLAENQTARTLAMHNLARVAFTDFLTGLKTRGYFEQELEQEIKRTLRRGSSCGLLLLDLDDFKHINDRYGHHAGDEILRQFARVLTRDMREIDTVARYGGDEFAIILPDTDSAGARFVATRLRDAVRAAHFHAAEISNPLQMNVSIGVAVCPHNATDPEHLLRGCDLALYRAKRDGKNRLSFADTLTSSA